MKKTLLFLALSLLISCSSDNNLNPNSTNNENPIVKSNAAYEVIFEENIKYAVGLSHNGINSSNSSIGLQTICVGWLP